MHIFHNQHHHQTGKKRGAAEPTSSYGRGKITEKKILVKSSRGWGEKREEWRLP